MPRKNLKGYIFSKTIVGCSCVAARVLSVTFQSFVVLHLVNETSAIPKQIPIFLSQNIQYFKEKPQCFVLFSKSHESFSRATAVQ